MSENDPSLLEVISTIVEATLFHLPLEEMMGVQLIFLLLVALQWILVNLQYWIV